MSIELVMPSNHFILCCPLVLHSILASMGVFSIQSAICINHLIKVEMQIDSSFLGHTLRHVKIPRPRPTPPNPPPAAPFHPAMPAVEVWNLSH